MTPVTRTSLAALAACAFAAAPARADWLSEPHGAGGSYTAPQFPVRTLVQQPLTLSQGLWRLDVPAVVNLSSGATGKPITFPVALDYGVTPEATVGIYHQRGLCLPAPSGDCARAYDDVGARVRLSVLRLGSAQVVAQAGVLASQFDNVAWDGSVGVSGKATLGAFAVLAQVNANVALSGRDTRFYKELVSAQLDGQAQLGEGVAAFVYAGAAQAYEVVQPFKVPSAFPVGAGLEWSPTHHLTLGLQFAWPDLFGSAGGSDQRQATATVRGWF